MVLKVLNPDEVGARRGALLWQRGFREEEAVIDGVPLGRDGTAVFVRAPLNREDAWKRVEAELAKQGPEYADRLLLSYARLSCETEQARFRWEFMFGLKEADGGLCASVDLNDGKVTLDWRP